MKYFGKEIQKTLEKQYKCHSPAYKKDKIDSPGELRFHYIQVLISYFYSRKNIEHKEIIRDIVKDKDIREQRCKEYLLFGDYCRKIRQDKTQ